MRFGDSCYDPFVEGHDFLLEDVHFVLLKYRDRVVSLGGSIDKLELVARYRLQDPSCDQLFLLVETCFAGPNIELCANSVFFPQKYRQPCGCFLCLDCRTRKNTPLQTLLPSTLCCQKAELHSRFHVMPLEGPVMKWTHLQPDSQPVCPVLQPASSPNG